MKLDPDLLFFAGDQSYHHTQHTFGWLEWGLQFRDILRDRPVVAIPDDHDVGHPNLWVRGHETVLVPVGGLCPTTSTPTGLARRGMVEASTFREGHYRVTATSTDDHAGESLVFDSTTTLLPGSAVELAIDTAQLWTMPSERSMGPTQTS